MSKAGSACQLRWVKETRRKRSRRSSNRIDDEAYTTWQPLYDKLRPLLETATVKSQVEGNKAIDDEDATTSQAAAFKATVGTTATTITPSAAAQQQATSTAGGSVPTDVLTNAVARAFAAGVEMGGQQRRGGKGQDGGGKGGKGGSSGASGDADRVCYDFQRGKCRRGASCKFQHTKGGADTGGGGGQFFNKDCRYGKNCRRSTCDFRHPDGRKGDDAESDGSRQGTPTPADKRPRK